MSEYKTYTIKGIPEPTWKALKVRCALESVTIKDILMKLIKSYGKGL